ncbi:unnamed protein product [Brassica oleracea var. botrytis]
MFKNSATQLTNRQIKRETGASSKWKVTSHSCVI